MGILDFIFKKKKAPEITIELHTAETQPPEPTKTLASGEIDTQLIDITDWNRNSIKARFIAFDTETTGLSPVQDRIIDRRSFI